jgi:hypothetical protein
VNDAQQGVKNLASQNQPYAAANPITNTVGNIGGNIGATAPLAALAPAAATASALGRIGTGAALGAASGAMAPSDSSNPDYWGQKASQAGTGAAFGAGGSVLANALGKVITGATGTAQRQLADAGVTMTPGQALGGGFARTEEKLTSVPILGDMIKNAQQRSVQSFNKAIYNDVLAPIGKTYTGDEIGQAGVKAVKGDISQAYNGALSNMTFKATDPAFQADIGNLTQMAKSLPASQQQTFTNVLKTQIFGKLGPQGNMDGETLKGVQSELSRTAKGYLSDPSYDNRQLGAAISEMKNAVDSSLARYNAPQDVSVLQAANAAFAKYARLRAAAGSKGAMDNGGVFTAAQMQGAVRSADSSVGKGSVATGDALMQKLSGAGQAVLGSKYPDSGTPGRAALMGLIGALGGGGATAAGFGAPALAAGGAGVLAALPYTGLGQRAAQAALMARPAFAQPVGQFVQKGASPFAAALGAALVNH